MLVSNYCEVTLEHIVCRASQQAKSSQLMIHNLFCYFSLVFCTYSPITLKHTCTVSLFLQAMVSEQVDGAAQMSNPDSDWACTRGSDPRPENQTLQRSSTTSIRRQQVGLHALLPIMTKTACGRGANMPALSRYHFAQIRLKP